MNTLYPIKFHPVYKDKIWGGTKIKTLLGYDFTPLHNCGEMWVLSGVEGDESIVENGFLKGNNLNELVEIYMGDLVGEKVFDKYGEVFPILVKFIDTNDYLSIQVHPDDDLSLKRTGEARGKTEMWYVLDAEPDSELISGFKNDTTKESYLRSLENKNLKEILNVEKVNAGDTFFIPAGRVHAIGRGILLAEIQQTSDTTYRIYDWDRLDVNGLPRELHTELAMDAIDFSRTADPKARVEADPVKPVTLADCPYFVTRLRTFDGKAILDYGGIDSFVILLCIEGVFELICESCTVPVHRGELVLLPASIENYELRTRGRVKVLETFVPDPS